MSNKKLGFIGVGAMGGPMAMRLLDAGYALTICDVSESAVAPFVAKGATRVETPKEVADNGSHGLAANVTEVIDEVKHLARTETLPHLDSATQLRASTWWLDWRFG